MQIPRCTYFILCLIWTSLFEKIIQNRHLVMRKAAWKYAYDRVNDSVTGKTTTIEEKKMHKMMVVPLFGVFEENNTRISTEFVPLFSENEIKRIS